ncbi:MAG: type IV toxin-antitoxin system AbiEi family antitoxin domain-containing protein, partial [Phycicoccus sp.]
MDARLRALAEARGGVVTASQAAAVDIDEHGLVRACRVGDLVRVRRSAYVLGSEWHEADGLGRHRLRTRAVLASRAASSVASHESALALHLLPVHGAPPSVVDLLGPVTRTRLVGGARIHPAGAVDHVVADGFRCVPVAVAIAQVALRSGLLPGLIPADRALHDHRLSLDELEAALTGLAVRPRDHRTAEAVVERADGRSESAGETRTRVLLTDLGFDVRSQVEISDEDGTLVGRVDFLIGAHVAVEFDGRVKYGGADGRDALVAEKRREDALRSLGYVVVRVTWADLDHP